MVHTWTRIHWIMGAKKLVSVKEAVANPMAEAQLKRGILAQGPPPPASTFPLSVVEILWISASECIPSGKEGLFSPRLLS